MVTASHWYEEDQASDCKCDQRKCSSCENNSKRYVDVDQFKDFEEKIFSKLSSLESDIDVTKGKMSKVDGLVSSMAKDSVGDFNYLKSDMKELNFKIKNLKMKYSYCDYSAFLVLIHFCIALLYSVAFCYYFSLGLFS